jgi:hypothetical protein
MGYGGLLLVVCLSVAAAFDARGWERAADVARWGGAGAIVAALLDAVENAALLNYLHGYFRSGATRVAWAAASIKFALVYVLLAGLLVAAVVLNARPR